jgi:parallel beta-helix repeat protein
MKTKITLLGALAGIAFFFAPSFAFANTVIDANGFGCNSIGSWNSATKTCTLARDIFREPIVVAGDGITIDGNGHTMFGPGNDVFFDVGVDVEDHANVIVRNLNIRNFTTGMFILRAPSITIEGNTVSGGLESIRIMESGSSVVKNNTIKNGEQGLLVEGSFDGQYFGNTISSFSESAIIIGAQEAQKNVFYQNTIRDSSVGVTSGQTCFPDDGGGGPVVSFFRSLLSPLFPAEALAATVVGTPNTEPDPAPCPFIENDNIFFANNFINNADDVSVSSIHPRFFADLPEGGNYWSDNTACVEANGDNVCDTRYQIGAITDADGNQIGELYDEFPWEKENGWNLPTTAPVTLAGGGETEDDGIQDQKGVADKTKFTFNILYTGTTAPSNVTLWTNANDTTKSYALSLSVTTTNDGDFTNGEYYEFTGTFPQGKYGYHFEANGEVARFPETGELNFTTGYSNVAFLPGIMGSRLYRPNYSGGTDQLWEPNIENDVTDLYLDEQGNSIREDIYTKDILNEKNVLPLGQGNIYKSFQSDLKKWKETDHIIEDYSVIPYDWRLSLDEILNNGSEFSDGRIYYAGDLSATNTPYIIQEIRRLARTSDTGKVTIVAHSNGGLLAKALTEKLGAESETLLDQMIFVAVPQAGTPQAIGALLHGYDQGLPFDWLPVILTPETSRTFASTSPMTYNLLPSYSYFTQVDDAVITIATTSELLAPWVSKYGEKIHSTYALQKFIADTERTQMPVSDAIVQPIIGKNNLFTFATELHTILDNWTPPSGVALTEIAGWGEETLKTIEYYEGFKTKCTGDIHTCRDAPALLYSPKTTIDGDGTVVVPSALWTPLSTGVKKYWVDLDDYNNTRPQSLFHPDRKHADIFEVPELRDFTKNLIVRNGLIPENYIKLTKPENTTKIPNLRFVLHSPLSIDLYDDLGNHTGYSTSTGILEENIPESRYITFGEVKYISVPLSSNLHLAMNGYATGSFTLDIEEVQGETSIAKTTFAAVPSQVGTIATLDIPANGGIASSSPLSVDENGDGTIDITLTPKIGEVVLPDFTNPEAKISVDPATKDLLIEGIDENPTTVSKSGNAYIITDSSGNKTTLFFQKTFAAKRLTFARLTAVQYGNDPKISLPSSSFLYLWNPALVSQTVVVKKDFVVEAMYNKKKDETTVWIKKKGAQVQKQIFSGLKVVKLTVDKGTVGYEI